MTADPAPRTVVLDVRCLQDPNYARRGVGRHALALLRGAPPGLRLTGLVDPALPPLVPEARSLFQDVHANAYACAAASSGRRPAGFVALSPMTHDPLFASRLLADRALPRAAVVYDFIPRRFPERYLPGPAERLNYATALWWLRRCDLFAPISHATAAELRALLGVPERDIAVTGAPLDPIFEAARDLGHGPPPAHVLVVGGGDSRKNPEVVVRAHAGSAALQRDGIPLVVAGNYDAAAARAFRAIAAASGGRPDLVQVPGHVPDAALVGLYAAALAIVCPSLDEGFSLPVVEGMAAGVPCLASDIPAHRELVEDASQRFPATDDAALAALLERVANDPAWRAAALARQALMWPRFRAPAVAARFWTALLRRLDRSHQARDHQARAPAAPAIHRGRRPRLALLSPLPPDRSGVADYTAATCRSLAGLVDLQVFTNTEQPAPLPGTAPAAPLSALPHLLPEFDRVVSVVGNSHFHLPIFDLLQRYGGACIAHDARMFGFYRYLLGQERALAVASRELGRAVGAPEMDTWLADEGRLEALFLGEVAASAAPAIVHSPITARLFAERYGVRPAYLPFSIYRPWSPAELTPARRAAARARLGLEPNEVAIATFGFVHVSKAPEECVWALDLLRGWGVPASLHFVGGAETLPDGGVGLLALAERLGLAGKVRLAKGFVSEQTYCDHLVGADLGIQLRTYGFGSVSGGLLDCAAAGLPSVANQSLGDAVEVPRGYVRCIPDALSPLLLAEALAGLLEAGPGAVEREAERRAFSAERSFDAYARGLCDTLGLDLARADRRSSAA